MTLPTSARLRGRHDAASSLGQAGLRAAGSPVSNGRSSPARSGALPVAREGLLRFVSAALAMIAAAIFAAPLVSAAPASLQQAPNTRVVIDLPQGFEPSRLFSGFQNDTTGVTFVILEAPRDAYAALIEGFDPASLRKRGITDPEPGRLERSDEHVYMRARQISPSGVYAKFFVAFRTPDQSILVSVNVPQTALENGAVTIPQIEEALTTARTVPLKTTRELYRLTHLGPFKEAGTLIGTNSVLTLDGKLTPHRQGLAQPAFIVAPSLDKRTIPDPEMFAARLLSSLSGYSSISSQPPRRISIAGMDGIEIEATAVNDADGTPMRLIQTLLLGRGGGYFRLLGLAPEKDAEALLPRFREIAAGFELVTPRVERSDAVPAPPKTTPH